MKIRGGAGFGDAMYVRVVAEYFVRRGESVKVATPWPDVFIGSGASTFPFTRDNIDVIAHYVDNRYRQETTQFRDMCLRAGIRDRLKLEFKWEQRNPELLRRVREQAAGRPIVLVHAGREPFGRTDGLGLDLIPRATVFAQALFALSDCLTIGIGDGKRQFYTPEVELDLVGKTSVRDILDLGTVCTGVLAQVSFCVPLAECFGKPFLGVWSAKGLRTPSRPLLTTVTPGKILEKPTSLHVIDDWEDERINGGVNAFRQLLGSR